MINLLTQPLITAQPVGRVTLPGLLAALGRDDVESMPALRPHQAPAWHMFLVQLAAQALLCAGEADPPQSEERWCALLRGLTPGLPGDELWSLVVEDWTKPAFLQPPVPPGVALKNPVPSADALDLLITAKNHDLKQTQARNGTAEDWIFALVSLQTGEGYGGAGNHGIARMNGGSSSRPMLAYAPVRDGADTVQAPRLGRWFRRDVAVLLASRPGFAVNNPPGFALTGGIGLTWLPPWPEGEQLAVSTLDPWFIEVCRRVRLVARDGVLSAVKGTSAAARIAAKPFKGALLDPWAPIHKLESKALTIGDGDFDYRRMVELLRGGDWVLPIAAQLQDGDGALVLVAAALARGNSRTDGFRYRLIPLRAGIPALIAADPDAIGRIADRLFEIVDVFASALRGALATAAAGGDPAKRKKAHYSFAAGANTQFTRAVDALFFPALWDGLTAYHTADSAAADAADAAFVRVLWPHTLAIFEAELPGVPCQSLLRPRAEANARRLLYGLVMKHYRTTLQPQREGEVDDVSGLDQ